MSERKQINQFERQEDGNRLRYTRYQIDSRVYVEVHKWCGCGAGFNEVVKTYYEDEVSNAPQS